MPDLYGCHSDRTGPEPRGRVRTTVAQDGWTYDGRRIVREIVTPWLPMRCGLQPQVGRGPDPMCKGCVNASE